MRNTFEIKPKTSFLSHRLSTLKGQEGKINHSFQLRFESIDDVPVELFLIKQSQSKNPERAGKFVFKYFSYQDATGKWNNQLPDQLLQYVNPILDQTDLSAIRTEIVKAIKANDMQFSINLPSKSPFLNITMGDGNTYVLYSDKDFPHTMGQPTKDQNGANVTKAYYLDSNAPLIIELTKSVNPEYPTNPYYRLQVRTEETDASKVLKPYRQAKVWSPDGDEPLSTQADTPIVSDVSSDAEDGPAATWSF